jgi:hypothetical protein
MRKVNIPQFQKEVLAIINANSKKITHLDVNEDQSVITFLGKNYSCTIKLNDKWIGYDLDINTPKGMVGCGMSHDTDIYPIYGDTNEEIALEIYDDLLAMVKAILNSHVYYTSSEMVSYTARKNDTGTYSVNFWERKRFLFIPYSSGSCNEEYSEAKFKKLKLNVLS